MPKMQHFHLECTIEGCEWRIHISGHSIQSLMFDYLLREHGDNAKHYAVKVTGRVTDASDNSGRDLSV